MKQKVKSKTLLFIFLIIMAVMIIGGIFFTSFVKRVLTQPSLYPHVLFLHILSVTLFFSNGVIGILWELRSLAGNRKDIIMHTYNTVAWLDARLSSPLIILSVFSGIMLSLMYGDIRDVGWLFLGFLLFLLSGAVWVISDIPTQYKIKKLIKEVDSEATVLPAELMRILKLRLKISLAGMAPLAGVFILMVYKPEIPFF